MTVVLTGRDLNRDQVMRVARHREKVTLDASAVEAMRRSREIVEGALTRGDAVYGLSTGVGVLKRVGISCESSAEFSRRLVRHHHGIPL